jgi:hypothetical protein
MMPSSFIHFLAGGASAVPFEERLRAALANAGYAPPPEDDLLDFVLTEFENEDFEYAQALLTSQEEAWHTVYFGPAASDLAMRDDTIFTARSRTQALSFALSELDRERELPSQAKVRGDAIELYRGGELLLRVAPLVFEPSNQVARQRIENDLEGLRQYGAEAHICKRLSNTPGLERLSESERPRGVRRQEPRQPFAPVICKTAASLAAGLRRGLADRFGLQMKQSHVPEVLAESVGAGNWAHLVAREAQSLCWTIPSIVCNESVTDVSAYRFYRTTAEGIWGFAQAVKQ